MRRTSYERDDSSKECAPVADKRATVLKEKNDQCYSSGGMVVEFPFSHFAENPRCPVASQIFALCALVRCLLSLRTSSGDAS